MKLTKNQKKELVIRYAIAIVLLILTVFILPGMFKRAKKDDALMQTEQSSIIQTTEIVTE